VITADLDADLDAYAELDVCAVSDAVDALGGRLDGWGATLTGPSAAWEGARVLGWAVTMAMAPGAAPQGSVHLGVAAIGRARPGNVIVVDNDARPDAGSWGGLLSTAAKTRHVAGVVTNGAARDVDEARELGFGLFSVGATPQTARGRCHETSCGDPVTIEGVRIATGDLVAADGTGVVVVAREHAIDVLDKALDLVRREAVMRQALLDGIDAVDVLGGTYEEMLTAGPDDAAGGVS